MANLLELLTGLMLAVAGIRLGLYSATASGRDWLDRLLTTVRGRPPLLLAAGVLAAGLLHSSSAVEVAALALAQAGRLPLAEALFVVIGANVGTTLTAQMAALHVMQVGAWLMAAGTVGAVVGKEGRPWVALFSLGALLEGLRIVGLGMQPLVAGLMARTAGSPGGPLLLHGFVVGWVVTGLVQSSTVVTTTAVSMVGLGALDPQTAVAVILGSNVGTVTTGLVASLFLGRRARRLALADFSLNLAGAAVAMALFPWFFALASALAGSPAQSVAHAHTFFNLLSAVVSVPLVPALARWLEGR